MVLRVASEQDLGYFKSEYGIEVEQDTSNFSRQKQRTLIDLGAQLKCDGNWGPSLFIASDHVTIPDYSGASSIKVIAEPGIIVRTGGHSEVIYTDQSFVQIQDKTFKNVLLPEYQNQKRPILKGIYVDDNTGFVTKNILILSYCADDVYGSLENGIDIVADALSMPMHKGSFEECREIADSREIYWHGYNLYSDTVKQILHDLISVIEDKIELQKEWDKRMRSDKEQAERDQKNHQDFLNLAQEMYQDTLKDFGMEYQQSNTFNNVTVPKRPKYKNLGRRAHVKPKALKK